MKKAILYIFSILIICLLATFLFIQYRDNDKLKKDLKSAQQAAIQNINESTTSKNCTFEEFLTKYHENSDKYSYRLVKKYSEGWGYFLELYHSANENIVCTATVTDTFKDAVSKYKPNTFTNIQIAEDEYIYQSLTYLAVLDLQIGSKELVTVNLKNGLVQSIFSTKYNAIYYVGRAAGSNKSSWNSLFSVEKEGGACQSVTTCATEIAQLEANVCKENKLGLWEVNPTNGKTKRLYDPGCK